MTITTTAKLLPALGVAAKQLAKSGAKSVGKQSVSALVGGKLTNLGAIRTLSSATTGVNNKVTSAQINSSALSSSESPMRAARNAPTALSTARFQSTLASTTSAMNQIGVKTPADSAIKEHVYKVFPNDLNSNDTIFGGTVMAACDRLALVVAERHSGKACVTVSVDSFHFLSPAKKGETLIYSAAVNRAWGSSMEIGVRVSAENSMTGETRHIDSAYLTFVALDKAGKPAKVPQLRPTTEAEARRFKEAQFRREKRLEARDQIKTFRAQEAQNV